MAHPIAIGTAFSRSALCAEPMTCLDEGPLSFAKDSDHGGCESVSSLREQQGLGVTALLFIMENSCSVLIDFAEIASVHISLGLCPLFVHFCLSSSEDAVSQAAAESLQVFMLLFSKHPSFSSYAPAAVTGSGWPCVLVGT